MTKDTETVPINIAIKMFKRDIEAEEVYSELSLQTKKYIDEIIDELIPVMQNIGDDFVSMPTINEEEEENSIIFNIMLSEEYAEDLASIFSRIQLALTPEDASRAN